MGRVLTTKYDQIMAFLDHVARGYCDKLRRAQLSWQDGSRLGFLDMPYPSENRQAFVEQAHAAIWHCHNILGHHFAKKLGEESRRASRASAQESRQWLAEHKKMHLLSVFVASIERITKTQMAHELLNTD